MPYPQDYYQQSYNSRDRHSSGLQRSGSFVSETKYIAAPSQKQRSEGASSGGAFLPQIPNQSQQQYFTRDQGQEDTDYRTPNMQNSHHPRHEDSDPFRKHGGGVRNSESKYSQPNVGRKSENNSRSYNEQMGLYDDPYFQQESRGQSYYQEKQDYTDYELPLAPTKSNPFEGNHQLAEAKKQQLMEQLQSQQEYLERAMQEGRPLEEVLTMQRQFLHKVGVERQSTGALSSQEGTTKAQTEMERLKEQYEAEMEKLRQEQTRLQETIAVKKQMHQSQSEKVLRVIALKKKAGGQLPAGIRGLQYEHSMSRHSDDISEIPIAILKQKQREEFQLRMASDPHLNASDYHLIKRPQYSSNVSTNSGKPPRPLGLNHSKSSKLSSSQIVNLAKHELSTSQISNEEKVAFLRNRLPPGPTKERRDRIPNDKLWLTGPEMTNCDPVKPKELGRLLKQEKRVIQRKVNDSFDKGLAPDDKEHLLEASHVFTVTQTSLNKTNSLQPGQTARTTNTSIYLPAQPGGKGIERLKEMYKAFVDEQDDRLMQPVGPRQLVGAADLLLNKVFSNPMNRNTEIVTDPLFKHYIEQNQLIPHHLRRQIRAEGRGKSHTTEDGLFVFEPTYQLQNQIFKQKEPAAGFDVGLTQEEYDQEHEKQLQHTQFLMQQRAVGYEIMTTALLKRGNDINKKLNDIDRVQVQDEIVQDALQRKKADENHIYTVHKAVDLIRQDLQAVKQKQAQLVNEAIQTTSAGVGTSQVDLSKSQLEENAVELEDVFDVPALEERIEQIENCEPLKASWVRETLVLNLRQVVKDVTQIRHIKSLPPEEEYIAPDDMQQNIIVMSLTHEERLQNAMERKGFRIKKIRDKVLYRLKAAEEQFRHFLNELDYAWRLLEEQPLSSLVGKYHPIDTEVKEGELGEKKPPLSVAEKELAIQQMIQMKRLESPEKDFVIRTPNKDQDEGGLQAQQAVAKEDLEKTLALNQRLMDVAENQDVLLHQYAGDDGNTRAPKKYFMFYQQHNPIIMDDGEQAAALRILNISRQPKSQSKKKKVKFEEGPSPGPVQGAPGSTVGKLGMGPPGTNAQLIQEGPPVEKPLTKANLLRKMAGDMPSSVAVKFQGRSLASIGQNISKKNDERYMYQFLARQRVDSYWQERLDKEKPQTEQKAAEPAVAEEVAPLPPPHKPVKYDIDTIPMERGDTEESGKAAKKKANKRRQHPLKKAASIAREEEAAAADNQ